MTGIAVKQLAHVCIFAHDLEQSRAFYRDILGLPIAFNFTRDGDVFGFYLGVGNGSFIEVFHKPGTSHAETNQINHLCLEVEDIAAAVEHLNANGVEATPKKIGCDGTWQSWIRDPSGVKIELFQYTENSAQFTGGDRVATW